MPEEVLKLLKELSAKKTGPQRCEENGDDFYNACDMSGGNYDDCYNNGVEDGEIELANQILEIINKQGAL